MQSDEEIGRMVASVPVAIGRAMEHFAEKLLEAAARCVQTSPSRTLSPQHIKQAVLQNPHFMFLEPLMREVPLPSSAGFESPCGREWSDEKPTFSGFHLQGSCMYNSMCLFSMVFHSFWAAFARGAQLHQFLPNRLSLLYANILAM
ncbi:unnamed protein product [Gongylonema pulchrum]|uniref:CBFD_NFYB_HMF domain-containing protein n=1 Tax=Gongylonema pulchrum TaxID=637853 RepID=A0A183EQ59_9BILA|nr:unnamed protein product [Gongylonema pulchrum]